MICLDGSQKSGSGTIVRYAVSLCALCQEKLHLFNIRARRDKPGLRPQHLATVLALEKICGGRVEGARLGAQEIVFTPGKKIRGGDYEFDIKTSGSATMLVLSLLPLLIFAPEGSNLLVRGGTFQDYAPSAFHMEKVLFPHLREMGLSLRMKMLRPGYVPRGEGLLQVEIDPLSKEGFRGLEREEQGSLKDIKGIALSSHLKERQVSRRLAETCTRVLGKKGYPVQIEERLDESALQPGAALALWAETQKGCILGADMAGKPRRPSEYISRYVARTLLEDLHSGATVDRFLADQLVIFAALARGETRYLVPGLTEHLSTNLWLVSQILGAFAEVDGDNFRVKIKGIEIKKG